MPRLVRVRIAIGLTTSLIGLAIAIIGPGVVAVIANAVITSGNYDPYDIEDGTMKQMAAIRNLAQIARTLSLCGFGISAIGGTISFVAWIRWFVREDEPTLVDG